MRIYDHIRRGYGKESTNTKEEEEVTSGRKRYHLEKRRKTYPEKDKRRGELIGIRRLNDMVRISGIEVRIVRSLNRAVLRPYRIGIRPVYGVVSTHLNMEPYSRAIWS